jgi:hypothetical protein
LKNVEEESQEKPLLFVIKEKFEKKVWVRRSIELFGVILCLFLAFIPNTTQGDK